MDSASSGCSSLSFCESGSPCPRLSGRRPCWSRKPGYSRGEGRSWSSEIAWFWMVARAPRLMNWPPKEIQARPGFLPIVLGPVHMVSADSEEATAVLRKTAQQSTDRLTGARGRAMDSTPKEKKTENGPPREVGSKTVHLKRSSIENGCPSNALRNF